MTINRVPTWHQRALQALHQLAVETDDFTADDLLQRVGHPDLDHAANGANNAVGSVFREARAQGMIQPTGNYRQSRQPKRKGGAIAVWRGRTDQGRLL